MNSIDEKRAYTRRNYPVPIDVSYICKEGNLSAQSLNHCEGGMCFESMSFFHPDETLNIRIKDFHPHGPCTGLCEGLRSITLAEVKWCLKVPDSDTSNYRVGIKFYAPIY
jgi:hypothetical protein